MKTQLVSSPSKVSKKQANTTTSSAPLRESITSEGTGQKLINLLDECWVKGVWLQSQTFRDNAFIVALAASEGFITTKGIASDSYYDRWLITDRGIQWLQQNKKKK